MNKCNCEGHRGDSHFCPLHGEVIHPDHAEGPTVGGKPEKKGYVLEGGATLNAGYFHEILDRGNLICSMIDDYLIEHPGMTLEMNKKCEAAQQLLCEVTNLSCAEQDRIFGADLAKPSEDSKIVLDIRLAHKCYMRGQDPYHDLGRLMERITNILKQLPSPPDKE